MQYLATLRSPIPNPIFHTCIQAGGEPLNDADDDDDDDDDNEPVLNDEDDDEFDLEDSEDEDEEGDEDEEDEEEGPTDRDILKSFYEVSLSFLPFYSCSE